MEKSHHESIMILEPVLAYTKNLHHDFYIGSRPSVLAPEEQALYLVLWEGKPN